jgi:hypothetical protein
MKWETPAFVEINMSAEIGGYGGDYGDRDILGPDAPEPPKGSSVHAGRRRAEENRAAAEQR